jgi:hypothetical protein
MSVPTVEEGFGIWREEATPYVQLERDIDAQVPIIALTGLYSVLVPNLTQRTSYDWRKAIVTDQATSTVLAGMLPEMQRHYFDTSYYEPIDWYREEPKERLASQLRSERKSILDGLPDDVSEIRADEYYLARVLGHAAHNMTVIFEPLKLSLRVSAPVLLGWFPRSFRVVEDNWR